MSLFQKFTLTSSALLFSLTALASPATQPVPGEHMCTASYLVPALPGAPRPPLPPGARPFDPVDRITPKELTVFSLEQTDQAFDGATQVILQAGDGQINYSARIYSDAGRKRRIQLEVKDARENVIAAHKGAWSGDGYELKFSPRDMEVRGREVKSVVITCLQSDGRIKVGNN